MAEVYPSDDELLNIESDSETGVEYIPTGTSPYYLRFRKLLYRLLLAAKLANDFRVYDEGSLDVGIKAGKFWFGTQLKNVDASSGNTLADDKENIYLYINSSGSLVTTEYSSFPDMATMPHVRLAVVETSDGDIVSITDSRSANGIVLPYEAGGIKKIVEAHTSDDTLVEAESGSVHSNLGATGTVTLTLPASADEGVVFTFAVQAGQELRIEPGSAAIMDDSGTTAGKYKYANSIGTCLTVIADSNGDWAMIAKNGSWSEEA
ncbi:MAG: hypothetical protein ACYSSI_01970 [Planctomycetota bacterium]|jgi:hypothetical protein